MSIEIEYNDVAPKAEKEKTLRLSVENRYAGTIDYKPGLTVYGHDKNGWKHAILSIDENGVKMWGHAHPDHWDAIAYDHLHKRVRIIEAFER